MKFDFATLNETMGDNPSFKAILDMVAYKVSQNKESKSAGANLRTAEDAITEYVSDHFKDPEAFLSRISLLSGDTRALQDIAEGIYRYHYRRRELTFDMVKDRITRDRDIALRTITDLVAFKIYQSPDDKGAEVNFITAETFVAQYVSEHFASMEDFDRRLQELGHNVSALRAFADDIYRYYHDHRPR